MDGIQYTGMTDVGRKRSGNEDRFHVGQCWDDRHLLALCIDGCGGYSGGQIAAQMTVDHVLEYLNEHPAGEKVELLKQAVIYANNLIHETRNTEPALERMCCVVTAALFELDEASIHMVHVGDSRLYAIADERIIKLSHDHSAVGRDEESGILTEIEAMQSPVRNVIERAVGERNLENDTDYIETEVYPMNGGITWLFCSDGLTDMITSAEIVDIIGQDISLDEKAGKLVAAANDAGGKDNITVILVQADGQVNAMTESVMNKYAYMVNRNEETDYDRLMDHMFRNSDDNESEEVQDDSGQTEQVFDTQEDIIGETLPLDQIHSVTEAEQTEPDTDRSQDDRTPKAPEHDDITAVAIPRETVSSENPTMPSNDRQETSQKNPAIIEKADNHPIETADADAPKRTRRRSMSRKTLVRLLVCIIAVTFAVLLGLYLKQQKELQEQKLWQQEEVIRQEILRRELYYNIKDKEYLLQPDKQ